MVIPLDATDATLVFWLYPASSEPPHLNLPSNILDPREADAATFGDAQVVPILDQFGNELEQLVNMRRNNKDWLPTASMYPCMPGRQYKFTLA